MLEQQALDYVIFDHNLLLLLLILLGNFLARYLDHMLVRSDDDLVGPYPIQLLLYFR